VNEIYWGENQTPLEIAVKFSPARPVKHTVILSMTNPLNQESQFNREMGESDIMR
jgi:hypothetical protein